MPRISLAKLKLISETVKKLGYVRVRSLRRWFNFASIEDAIKALEEVAKRDKDIELVYTLTFEKPGVLTTYTVEEVGERNILQIVKKMEEGGWILKSRQLTGAKAANYVGG